MEEGKASLNGTPNGNVYKNLQKENDSLKKLIDEITIANDILKKRKKDSQQIFQIVIHHTMSGRVNK